MPRTYNTFRQRIVNLQAAAQTYHGADEHDGPLPTTRPVTVLQVKNHRTIIDGFVTVAKSIKASPGFDEWAALPENVDDAAAIDELIAEYETHAAEVAELTHHDNVWNSLPALEREILSHRIVVNPDAIKHLNARVQLKKIGQPKIGASESAGSN
ncbi:MAG TPA: hypothetical protein VKU62_08770 [Thermoanaerobaculia bacterium]|nr:hypothetical protein [Thermoanaerobaculia bacterium]